MLSLAGLANASGAPGAGPVGFGRGGRLQGSEFVLQQAAVISGLIGWTRFLGQSEGLAPLVESTGNKSMKGAGAAMPRAQGFRYVCSDSYRWQAVQSYSG